MWRDELEAWMIVRDAVSLPSLAENMRYQGHPMFWHLILYPITRLTRNPFSMQMAHLVIATLAAFIFLRSAPFSKTQRGLFVFGYFPFFEYATISRGYAIGVLLLFIFCTFYEKVPRNYMSLSLVLYLLCQCNALAAVLAIALGITIFLEPLLLKDFSAYKQWRFYAAIAIFSIGLTASIIQMIPPPDSYWYYPNATTNDILQRLTQRLASIWNVFIPIPRVEHNFWESNVITYLPLQEGTLLYIRLAASMAILLVSFSIVARKRIPALYYILCIVGITAFDYIYYGGTLRHKGHYYLAFVTSLWIGSYYQTKDFNIHFLDHFFNFFERNKRYFLTVVFIAGVFGAIVANYINYAYPFSESRETADYIKQHGLQSMPIAGHMDYAASAVSAYIDKPLYYPVDNRVGTFMVWTKRRDESVDAFKLMGQFRERLKTDILLVLNAPPAEEKIKQYRLTLVKSFTKSARYDENFYLYIMH